MTYELRLRVVIAAASLAGCALPTRLLHRSPAGEVTSSAPAPAAALAVLPDDGITSDTHRDYVGQIVFANGPIAAEADASAFVAEIYADEPLYARAYLPHSIENVPVYEPHAPTRPLRTLSRGYYYRLYVDGRPAPQALASRAVPRDRRTTTTLALAPHPARGDGPTPRPWVELINALAPGEHRVRLELWANDRGRQARAPVATGEIVVTKPDGVTIDVGRTFGDLERGMRDSDLERLLLAGAGAFAAKHGWNETMAEVAIRSAAWIDVRHATLRHVIGRQLHTWVRADWPDGRCTAQAMTFQQEVKRAQPVGPIYVGSSGEQLLLDCAATAPAVVGDRWHGRTRKRPLPTGTAAAATTIPPTASASTATSAPTRMTAAPAPLAPMTPAPTPPAATRELAAPAPAKRAVPVGGAARARSQWFALGLGVAANARDASGVASYGSLGVYLGRVQLGVGATWPLNAVAYTRVAVIAGRFEIAPMLAMTVLAEPDAMTTTTTAIAGGLSVAYQLTTGSPAAGLRLDALASYNPAPDALAIPVLGSMFVRF